MSKQVEAVIWSPTFCVREGVKKKLKKNGIFQIWSDPPSPPYLKKNKNKKIICLFHVSEHVDHFKATFFSRFF